jgi:23S rRNA (pseudouridine1915-N3)-methyltransferase
MKLALVCVGRAGRVLAEAIAEYESRAGRYWDLDVIEVREERVRGGGEDDRVRTVEGERILKRVPRDLDIVALTRRGAAWSSTRLARHLEQEAARAGRGEAYVIGGAFGLSAAVLKEAKAQMQLSRYTLPHDFARLLLLEQFYRAGTIVRGEPYHKGADAS